MQSYLVGGAVRDKLLGLPVEERDFVVVGATPQEMLDLGYRQVGQDFPVFLHPETHEEYALARTLRGGASPSGMPHTDESVSLQEDLARRDLTINALAETEEGQLIDPFGGEEDLHRGVLRHASPAFAEDPIRILRVARFMARYVSLGFTVAPETLALMQEMVREGAVDALVPERVWQELVSALKESDPRPFFDTLRECSALSRVLPEIDGLYGVPQPTRWHPEVDCGVHTLMALRVACELSDAPEVRFAVLTHDLGKATTPAHVLPSHYGHEGRGERLVKQLCQRLKAPVRFRDLAMRCATYHGYTHRLYELRPKTIHKLLSGLDAFRQPERLKQFLLVCEADYRGREGFHERSYPQSADLWRLYVVASGVTAESSGDGEPGWLKGEAIRRERIQLIADHLSVMKQTEMSASASQAVENPEAGDIGANGRTEGAKEKD
ncbi:MAG: multifunctional CCA addition/repair protein [Candidatus Thiodiazotropha sp. (ex Gloverina cf. vestifex)]|nr:multifunctional CCA addition/repair protein [Candidatus Thiodiazotropha sp. (ex Gloverina cf. vestifex)]